VTDKPLRGNRRRPARGPATTGHPAAQRYRRLPKDHGLDPEAVRLDQAQRLRAAMIELIADKGYRAVRIADLVRLAHVSPPTLYSLYADKEQLFIGAYDDVAERTGRAILTAHRSERRSDQRLQAAMRGFAELAAREPQAISLLVLGALGAGPKVLRRRRRALEALESYIHANRNPDVAGDAGDLTVTAVLGGIREVTATRLRDGRHGELPALAERLADWAECYPAPLPAGLAAPARGGGSRSHVKASPRARRAGRRLPSGRSELPRELILKSQRERIVDATAAIVAEKGLAALTISEISRRASISNETFYSIYPSKHDAFLGAQKVGMHQALQITARAYGACEEDWPRAVGAGICALLGYLASEPAHARLALVETLAASPDAILVRQRAMEAFRVFLTPGTMLAEAPPGGPELVPEAIAGGIWQVLHHCIESGSAATLPEIAPQLTYFSLAPFLGAERAAEAALSAA
jgi:AcrR family transcriptional regulator